MRLRHLITLVQPGHLKKLHTISSLSVSVHVKCSITTVYIARAARSSALATAALGDAI
jgi:hypothetical protein